MKSRPTQAEGEARPPRYVVGIDLGTTNSAVAYVDTLPKRWRVESFRVLQVTAPGESAALDTLPSFHYEPAPGEFAGGAMRLSWHDHDPAYVTGAFARDHGAEVPGRMVNSAKSWLSHAGVDRTAALLPWHGASDVTKLSPVAVSARILAHVRQAWDAEFPDAPLAEQDVVVTVPASFDEIARELTVQAVRQAELPRVTLIEEPQAAFYAWIAQQSQQGDDWREQLEPGQTVLVCDVGGGTTDLTLIEVRESDAGEIALHRVAVGEHLILGGDNLDLALAHHVEARLGGDRQLDAAVWSVLVRRCQRAKEELFGVDPPEELTLHLPGGGSRLIGGGRQVTLTHAEVRELLLDGFLPRVGLAEAPETTRTGFQEFGLPYAADPAITRHLAAFLNRGQDGQTIRPDLLLFNGGLFESPAIRERVVDVLSAWFGGAAGSWSPRRLEHDRLALAVARGAAYYGMARRGEGVRIASGLARSYYVGIEQEQRELPAAICLVPAGLEEGQQVELEREFELRIRQPVEFPLYVSGARTNDRSGDVVDADPEQLRALPPIRTVLRAGKQAKRDTTRVHLLAGLSEIGTLETRCREVDGTRSWNLQFDVRAATRTDLDGHSGTGELAGLLDEQEIDTARALVRETFTSAKNPARLMRELETQLGMSRTGWPPAFLRRLWEVLLELEPVRQKSVAHESRWLNTLGYALRPGYGVALDDWRVARTWRLAPQGLAHDKNEACRAEWWILWRRLAGGMTTGQQIALAEPLLSVLRGASKDSKVKASSGRVSFRGGSHETAEMWRLLGSLELLTAARKLQLGSFILDAIAKSGPGVWNNAGVWALGRLGARVPQYGPLNTVLPAETAEEWVEKLIGSGIDDDNDIDNDKSGSGDALPFAIVQLARRTGDRYRDLPPDLRHNVLDWMARRDAREHYRRLVAEGGELEADEQRRAFGEALPAGIRLL